MELLAVMPALLPLAALVYYQGAEWSAPLDTDRFQEEYDYIIVGGGSAGAVLASRLSEDPDVSVLLLEAGGKENEVTDIPLVAAMLQSTPLDWAYQTEPQEASCFGLIDRRSRWPRGKVLGGCSVLNYMLYIRGNPRDYDRWAHEFGAHGWSWRDVFPYFLKSEDNRDPSVAANGFHSTGGYLTVSSPPFATPLAFAFVEAGKQMGYRHVDLNGHFQTGFSIPQGTIRRGARCSTSKAFLEPARHRKNLDVITFAMATRIHFDAMKKARAVEFDRLRLTHVVKARREVILSAGAINSPQLLMLSGIGPREHLQEMGIPVISDLPVGLNLQDHIYPGGIHFLIDQPVSIIQPRVFNLVEITKYLSIGKGPLTTLGGVEGLGFINTKFANASDDYPDIEIHFLSGSPSADGGQTFLRVQGLSDEMWRQVYTPYLYRDSFSFYPVLLRPKSVGYLKLRSRNPYDHPIIDPKYLTHPEDIMVLVEAMKFCIHLGQTPAFKKFGSRLFGTVFPGCEHYPMWGDEYLACVARTYTATIYHPIGTCKMGHPGDPTTVVDPLLRVKGVHGLRVIDASVMPALISGNTNAPVIMMAERMADIIKTSSSIYKKRRFRRRTRSKR